MPPDAYETIVLSKSSTKSLRINDTCFIFPSLSSIKSVEVKKLSEYAALLNVENNIDLLRWFYESTDFSGQVKEKDVIQIIEVIDILISISSPQQHESTNFDNQYTLKLAGALCSLLQPILRYGTTEVNKVFQRDSCLTERIIQLISYMNKNHTNDDMIESCFKLYSQLKRLQFMRKSSSEDFHSVTYDRDTLCDHQTFQESTKTESNDDSHTTASCKEIIKRHHDVWKKFQRLIFDQKNSTKREMLERLLEDKHKQLNSLDKTYQYETLCQNYQAATEELEQCKQELLCVNSKREQLQQEVTQLKRKHNEQNQHPITQSVAKKSLIKSIDANDTIVLELDELSPAVISQEQSERFIREICRRRTSFCEWDMRKSICGSLKHLGSDLYGSSVHFVHEIIQVNRSK